MCGRKLDAMGSNKQQESRRTYQQQGNMGRMLVTVCPSLRSGQNPRGCLFCLNRWFESEVQQLELKPVTSSEARQMRSISVGLCLIVSHLAVMLHHLAAMVLSLLARVFARGTHFGSLSRPKARYLARNIPAGIHSWFEKTLLRKGAVLAISLLQLSLPRKRHRPSTDLFGATLPVVNLQTLLTRDEMNLKK